MPGARRLRAVRRRPRAPGRRLYPHARVLELAAGTGIVTAGLVEALPDAEITATDLNPPMVELRRRRGSPARRGRSPTPMDLDLRRRLLRPGGLPVRGDVLPRPDRRLPRGTPGAGAGRARSSSTSGTPSRPTTSRPRSSTRWPRSSPTTRPTSCARIPHGYADPDADPGRRPGRRPHGRGAGARRAGRASAPSAAALAEGYCLGTPLRFELQERGDLADLVPQRRRCPDPTGSARVPSRAGWRRTSSARDKPG